jgi:hypothetical protein
MVKDVGDAFACCGREVLILAAASPSSGPRSISHDLVELGEIPQHLYGCNPGVLREGKPWDGVTPYREGAEVATQADRELKRRPEWVANWLAAAEMDRRVEELCERKGLRFAARMPFVVDPRRHRATARRGSDDLWTESAPGPGASPRAGSRYRDGAGRAPRQLDASGGGRQTVCLEGGDAPFTTAWSNQPEQR